MFDFEMLFMIGLKVLFALLMIGAVMTMAGYSVLAERKVSAWMQGRVGPNRTVLPLVGYIPFAGKFLNNNTVRVRLWYCMGTVTCYSLNQKYDKKELSSIGTAILFLQYKNSG